MVRSHIKFCLIALASLLLLCIGSLFTLHSVRAEEQPAKVISPNDLGYHDFAASSGVVVQLSGDKLYAADTPSIANLYADYVEVNGTAGALALDGYIAGQNSVGVNYTFEDNTIVFFFKKDIFLSQAKPRVVLKEGFPLPGGSVLEENCTFELDGGVWSVVKTQNSLVAVSRPDGSAGILVQDGTASVWLRFSYALDFAEGENITALAGDALFVNGRALSTIENAQLIWHDSAKAAELSMSAAAAGALNRYFPNDISVSVSFPVSAEDTLGLRMFAQYSNISGSWTCYEGTAGAVSIDPIGGGGIVDHGNLYEISLSFTEQVRTPNGFETFVQAAYLPHMFIDGVCGSTLAQQYDTNVIQMHYDANTMKFSVYFRRPEMDFSPDEDHEIVINGSFPVGDKVFGGSVRFTYSAETCAWQQSPAAALYVPDIGVSLAESDSGIAAGEDGSSVYLTFTAAPGLAEGALAAEETAKIRVNGYPLSEVGSASYRADKNALEISVRSGQAASFSEDKRNMIILGPSFLYGYLGEEDNIRFDYDGEGWSKSILADAGELSVSLTSSEGNESAFSELGYFYGIKLHFSSPVRASVPTVGSFESFVQEDYVDYISIDGVSLADMEKCEMHYNVFDDTLTVYFPRGAVSATGPHTVELSAQFPVSFGEDGGAEKVLGTKTRFISVNSMSVWREEFVYEREFAHDFAEDGLQGWNLAEDAKATEGQNGIQLNGYMVRGERTGNFRYEVSLMLGGGTAKIIFRTSPSGYGGYELVLDGDTLTLLRRRPYEQIGLQPQQIAQAVYPLSGDETVNVAVSAQDYNIYVYINGSASPVLAAFDYAYASGFYALEGDGCTYLSAKAEISHSFTAKNVAASLVVPQQPVNALRLAMPQVPAGFTVFVVSSSMKCVDRNGIVTLTEEGETGTVEFMVVNLLDDSYATVSCEVTIPACTVDPDAEEDAAYIESKQAEFSAIPAEASVESAEALLAFAQGLDRWKFAPENRKEFDKTIAVAVSLLRKSVDKYNGTWISDQYDFTAALQPPADLYLQARDIIAQVLSGTMPFVGMFAEDGANTVDFALYFDEPTETYHLYYIRGVAGYMWAERPTHAFGHAVSKDLVDWTVVQPVLESSVDGADDAQVWAPQVVRIGDKYYMFYTAVSTLVTQTIRVAVSDDLYVWHRVNEIPTLYGPPTWSSWNEEKWSDNRDPGVLVDEESGKIYLYYTVHAANVGYVMGIMSCPIDDLTSWTDEGYQKLPQGTATPPESIFVIKKDGKYHMFQTDYAVGIAHLVADNPIGPWVRNGGLDGGKASDGAASELVYNSVTDKWYYARIYHHAYTSLHFAVFSELIWMPDGSVVLKEIGSDYDVKIGGPVAGEGIYTFPDGASAGAKSLWLLFDEPVRNPSPDKIQSGLEAFVQKDYEELILFNGTSVKEINDQSSDGNYIQIHYNVTQMRLEILILKNNVTDTLAFEADKDNEITLKAGMPVGIDKTLGEDKTFVYSAATKAWSEKVTEN